MSPSESPVSSMPVSSINASLIEWETLRAEDLRALSRKDACVIIPVAAIEQHGPHLPVNTDTLIAREVALRSAKRATGARPMLVTPVVWTGMSEHHMSFGGTLSLDFDSFSKMLMALVRSITAHGFSPTCFMNSHGGNDIALRQIAGDCERDLNAAVISFTYFHLIPDALSRILEKDPTVSHAGEAETSMIMAIAPHLVRTDRLAEAFGPTGTAAGAAVGPAVHRWTTIESRTKSGVIGDGRAASVEKGRAILDAAADAVAAVLTEDIAWQ